MFSSEENSKKADSKKAVSFKADGEKAASVGENLKTWDQLDIASLSSEENSEDNGEITDSKKTDSEMADNEMADNETADNETADNKKEVNEKANSKKAAIEKFASHIENAVSEIEKVVNEKADSEKADSKKTDSKKAEIEKVVSGIEKIVNEKAARENMGAVKKARHPLAAFVFPEPPKEPPTEPVTEFQNLAGSLDEPLREPRPRLLSGTELIPLNEFSIINRNPNPNPNPNSNPNVPTEPPKKPLTEFQKLAGSLVEPSREPRIRALSGTEKIPLNEFPNQNINPNLNPNPNLNLNPNPNLNLSPNPNPNPNPNVPQRTLSMTRIDNLSMESLPNRRIARRETMPLLKKLIKKNKYSNALTFPFRYFCN